MWRQGLTFLLFLTLVLVCLTFPGKAYASSTRAGRGRQKEQDTKTKGKPGQDNSRSGAGSKKSSQSADLPSNFYERLGVSKKATEQEIRKAYRKLAIKVSVNRSDFLTLYLF